MCKDKTSWRTKPKHPVGQPSDPSQQTPNRETHVWNTSPAVHTNSHKNGISNCSELFILREILIKIKHIKFKWVESSLKGNYRPKKVGSPPPPVGGERQGKVRSYKNKVQGKSQVIQEGMYKKEKMTDAVSYYKPHPHLKCPHMYSVLKLSPSSGFLKIQIFQLFPLALTIIT